MNNADELRPLGESFALWNYGSMRRKTPARLRLKAAARQVWATAVDRLLGAVNRAVRWWM